MNRRLRLLVFSVAIALAAQVSTSAPLVVMVSIPPQAEIVERIGGDAVTIEILIPPGRSPATYEPSPRQLALVAKADILIPVGVPFERQVMRRIGTFGPDFSLCEAPSQGDDLKTTDAEPAHAPGGHDHHGTDPHFWLDPIRAIEYAETVCDCLCAAAPEQCGRFHQRLDDYQKELEAINHHITGQLAPLKGKTMVVFHPAFGHFAARYGLHQLAIERDGKEPSVRHLTEVINRVEALRTRAIFIQPQFASSSVYAIADATGAAIVELDPLAPDLAANLQRIADAVALALNESIDGTQS